MCYMFYCVWCLAPSHLFTKSVSLYHNNFLNSVFLWSCEEKNFFARMILHLRRYVPVGSTGRLNKLSRYVDNEDVDTM